MASPAVPALERNLLESQSYPLPNSLPPPQGLASFQTALSSLTSSPVSPTSLVLQYICLEPLSTRPTAPPPSFCWDYSTNLTPLLSLSP